MSSGAMIHIPGFIKIVSDIQKLIGKDWQMYRHDDLISLLPFCQNTENRIRPTFRRQDLWKHYHLHKILRQCPYLTPYNQGMGDENQRVDPYSKSARFGS
jgi:hypothetical protein